MTKESMDQFLMIIARETENGKMISEDDFIFKLEIEVPRVIRELKTEAILRAHGCELVSAIRPRSYGNGKTPIAFKN